MVGVNTGYVGPDRWSLWGNIREERTLCLGGLGGKTTESWAVGGVKRVVIGVLGECKGKPSFALSMLWKF